jgi:hypothetical protein
VGAIRGYSKDTTNSWRGKTMITIFFTVRQPIMLDVLPQENKFNQQYFIDFMFRDLKRENWKTGKLDKRKTGKPENRKTGILSSNAACNFLGAHG